MEKKLIYLSFLICILMGGVESGESHVNRISKHFYEVQLYACEKNVIRNLASYQEEIECLESYLNAEIWVKEDQILSSNQHFGTVFLVHQDKEVLESDYETLLQMTRLLLK